MIHISLECLWKTPPTEYLSVAIYSHPARAHPARMTGHYLHANATLLWLFFVSSLVLGATEWFETDFVNEEKREEDKEARHLQSLVDSINRKKREKWTKFFFSFRRRGIKIIKIFTCDTFIRHLSVPPDLFPTQRGVISAQLLAQWPPRIWFGRTMHFAALDNMSQTDYPQMKQFSRDERGGRIMIRKAKKGDADSDTQIIII